MWCVVPWEGVLASASLHVRADVKIGAVKAHSGLHQSCARTELNAVNRPPVRELSTFRNFE